MREAVERTLGEHRVVELGDPFIDTAIAGVDGGRALVARDDDLVDVTRAASGEPSEGEVIDDEQVGREVAPQGLAGRVVGAGLQELGEQRIGATAEHLRAGAARRMAQGFGQVRLPHADRAHEDHGFVPVEEAEAEQVPDTVAVEGDRGVPVEALEGGGFGEARLVEAAWRRCCSRRSISSWRTSSRKSACESVALRALDEPIHQGLQDRREPQALEDGFQ